MTGRSHPESPAEWRDDDGGSSFRLAKPGWDVNPPSSKHCQQQVPMGLWAREGCGSCPKP